MSSRDCQRIAGDLGAYVDGGLSPREVRGVEEHLRGCADCRAEAEDLGAVLDHLKRASQEWPADPGDTFWAGFEERVTADIDALPAPRPRWRVPALAAGLAAAAALVFVLVWQRPAGHRAAPDAPPAAGAVLAEPTREDLTLAVEVDPFVAVEQLSDDELERLDRALEAL